MTQVETLIGRLTQARHVVAGLHSGSVKMRMCIPPQADDTDLLVCGVIDDAIAHLRGSGAVWVPVEDRLPEPGQHVYIFRGNPWPGLEAGNDVRESTYMPSAEARYPFCGNGPSVSHWMPRFIPSKPEPPNMPSELLENSAMPHVADEVKG